MAGVIWFGVKMTSDLMKEQSFFFLNCTLFYLISAESCNVDQL